MSYKSIKWSILISFILSAVISVLFNSCSCGREKNELNYNQIYDNIFSCKINIEMVSDKIGIPVEDLVNMRYSISEVNTDVEDILKNLYNALNEFDNNRINKILNKNYKIKPSTHRANNFNVAEYRIIVTERNQYIDAEIPNLVGEKLYKEFEDYIDDKFAWYLFPINAWHYLWNSKETLRQEYTLDFNTIINNDKINNQITSSFSIYNSLIETEQKVLFGNDLNLPVLKGVVLEDAENIADKINVENLINRASIDLSDSIITFIFDILIAFVIWLVLAILIHEVIENKKKKLLPCTWNRKNSFTQNLILNGIALFSNYMTEKEAQEKIDEYNEIKYVLEIALTIISLLLTFFFIIKPQIKLEDEILIDAKNNITIYVSELDLGITEYFDGILDTMNDKGIIMFDKK